MIVLGIISIIVGAIAFYYSLNIKNAICVFIFIISIILFGFGIYFIIEDITNSKTKGKEIKNVKYYNIESTIILKNNIPIDTIYTIYYKKK